MKSSSCYCLHANVTVMFLYWCKIVTTGLIPHDWTISFSVKKEASQKALRHYFFHQTAMWNVIGFPRVFVPNTFKALLSGPFLVPLDGELVCSELISSSTGLSCGHVYKYGNEKEKEGVFTKEGNSGSRSPCNSTITQRYFW